MERGRGQEGGGLRETAKRSIQPNTNLLSTQTATHTAGSTHLIDGVGTQAWSMDSPVRKSIASQVLKWRRS